MPSSSSFHRSVPALHEFADINQLAKGNESVKTNYKDFLRNYLEDIRGTKDGHGFKQVGSCEIFPFISSPVRKYRQSYSSHHAIGVG